MRKLPTPVLDSEASNAAPQPNERELTIAEQIDAMTDPSFMTSLARGLAVIQTFGEYRKPMTIAQISQNTGIPRAAVRRCLLTLKQLGYVDAELNNFSLRPKVLTLGYSYLSSTPLTVSSQPYLNAISQELGESCSLAVLVDDEVLYVARSAASRVMSVALNTGSRLPAYCTSLGRIMLAHLSPADLSAYLARARLNSMTDKTVTSQKRLREILLEVRQDGYAINDEELELGLRSIAVPVRGAAGEVVAAINIGAQAGRVSVERMREVFLPVLQRGAQELSVLLP